MKEVFHKWKLIKYFGKVNKIHEIDFIKMLENFMFTFGYIRHRINQLFGTN